VDSALAQCAVGCAALRRNPGLMLKRKLKMTVTHQVEALENGGQASASSSCPSPAVRVLIVDDDPALRKILSVMLTQSDFLCRSAASGAEALCLLEKHPFEVVISDLRMPGISGMDLLVEVRQRYSHLAFLMVTGEDGTRVGVRAMQLGADDYLLKPFDADVVLSSLDRALHKRKLEREVMEYRLRLEEMVCERTEQLQSALHQTERSYEDTLEALGAAIDLRDSPTAGHSRRVFLYSLELAKSIGGLEQQLRTMAMGAWLHDIGKLAIPDRILLKPGPLLADEWQVMRRHARIGYELVKSISFLAGAAEIVLTHHERFDGSGYPQGLSAEEIPFGARIFAVADTLDAMTSDRPYRAALPLQAARDVIERGSGTLFDPLVAAAFLRVSNQTWAVIARETVAVQPSSVLAAGTIRILGTLPDPPPHSPE
jgi:response regulator RpfG family c-di-GMP phosphodiesterase